MDRLSWMPLLTTALIASALGALVASSMSATTERSAAASELPGAGGEAELAGAIERLAEEVRRLPSELEARLEVWSAEATRLPSKSDRDPVPQPLPPMQQAIAELETWLNTVSQRLEDLLVLASGTFELRVPPAGRTYDRPPKIRAEHMLLDYQEIVDRYGPPDSIRPQADYRHWTYAGGENGWIRFTFVDGRVSEVDWER